MWKDKCAPPHILPHAHMHSQLEMMQTVCVCEGGHVERQACPSTHSPSHTHAWPQKNQHSYLTIGAIDGLVGGPAWLFHGNWHVTFFGVTFPVHEMA